MLFAFCATLHAQIPAFPGAEGYGSHASGGRGGDVYIVTNLDSSGAGSFQDAVTTAPAAGRTIVFAVSGHIRIPSGSGGMNVSASKITIAGQTAPGDGICFWNNSMTFSGDDVVARFVRWRYGKQLGHGDALDINRSQRIILDHCDMMFSMDENLSSFGTPPEFFTYQWSVNAWGLQTHSAGGLWDINHATAHHTLWANNHTRNPKCISPSVFDWVNNLTFGWDIGFNMAASVDPVARLNIRGSTFSHGASTGEAIYGGGTNPDGSKIFKLFMSDSALDGNNNGVLDVSKTDYAMVSSTGYDPVSTAWPQTVDGVTGGTVIGKPVTTDPRLTAYKKVLSQAGATRMEIGSRPLWDEITGLCVSRTAALQRGIIADPLELGLSTGTAFADLRSDTAPADADKDGMPDYWEDALGFDKNTASNNTVLSGPEIASSFFPAGTPAGYTCLEEYLHFMAVPHGVVGRNVAASPSFIDVDLRKFTSGFVSSPVFTVSNIVGGTVSASGPGNAIIRFTPTLDTYGRGGFLFTVTDSEGATWTQQCCLLVLTTPPPRPVTWVGDGISNNWNTATANWTGLSGPTAFAAGDAVTFDATGSNAPAVNLNGVLQPDSVTVNATTKNFTFQGSGSITGGASLIKSGSGTLTISNTATNSFAAATLQDGTLSLTTSGALGGSPLSVRNGTLSLSADFSGPLTIEGTLSLKPSGTRTLNGAWTGPGTVNVSNTGMLTLGGGMAGFTGDVHLGASTGGLRLYGSYGSATAAFDLGIGTATLFTRNGGGTVYLGSLTGGPGTILSGASSTAYTTTYSIGATGVSTAFNGRITNGGQGPTAITKVGSGKLVLTGASTHSGATTVSGGELAMNGTFGTSAVTIGNGARLTGTGVFGGVVATTAGGVIAPGNDSAGTMNAAALSLTSPVLEFDLSNNPAGANDHVVASGAVNLSGVQTFAFNLTDEGLGSGTYNLVNTSGAVTGTNVSFVSNLPVNSRQVPLLERSADGVAPGYVRLVVTGTNGNLTWTGTNGGVWDLQATSSWTGANPATFFNFDDVTFTDIATTGAVNIDQPVAPRSLVVDNTAVMPYTFAGGPITGSTSLVKSGSGTLTLNLPQYTLVCGVTLDSPTVTTASTAGLVRGMTVTGTGIPAGTTIVSISAGSVTLSQNATATNASTSLVLESRNTYSGGTVINGGEVVLTSNAQPDVNSTTPPPANPYGLGTGTVTLNGGTLTLYGNLNTGFLSGPLPNDLIVPAGATATLNCTSRGFSNAPFTALGGALSGSGTLNLVVNFIRGGITGDWSGFTGTLNVKRLASGASDPRFQIANEAGLPLATVNLDQVTLDYTAVPGNDGVTVPIGSLSGISSAVISGGRSSTAPVTWRVGGLGTDATFAGKFTPYGAGGPIGLEKTGAGTWTLTGSGVVSAGITVEEGTLSYGDAATDSITGSSEIRVLNGGILQINSGASVTGASFDVAAGGTIRGCGNLNASLSSGGVLEVNGGTLAINGDATISGAVDFGSLTDHLTVTGALNLGGQINLPAAGLSPGRKVLITYTGALTLGQVSMGTPPAGYFAMFDTDTPGEFAVNLWDLAAYQLWQSANFGNTTDPAGQPFADSDGDGMANYEEWLAGTNPNDAGSSVPLLWAGDAVNTWDNGVSKTWLENAKPRVFSGRRQAIINDTGSNTPSIKLTGSLSPWSLTVDNSAKDFTLEGAGSLTGTMALTKTGSGTLTLPTANSFTGPTAVNGGRLILSGSLASTITAAGGTFAPQGAPVTTGGLDIAAGGRFEVRINGTTSGTQYDQLTVGGKVTLAGSLDIIAAPGLALGSSFMIVNHTGAGAVSGKFAGKGNFNTFLASGYYWQIRYTGGDGNDIVITTITGMEAWRKTWFNTISNSGIAADSADPDFDGETNLLEFATGQNPKGARRSLRQLVRKGAVLEFTYPRGKAAVYDGFTFTVEFSDTLAPGSWSSAGIDQNPPPFLENSNVQQLKVIVPAGTGNSRFVRLKVSSP